MALCEGRQMTAQFASQKLNATLRELYQEGNTWADPNWSLLDDRRGSLPAFPMEAVPESLHDWLNRAARGSGTTAAHVAAPLIGIASSLIGTARRIRASRSWSQPTTLWCALVGFSGTGKTPGIDATRKPVGHIEYQRRDKVAELQRQHETRAQAAKVAKKKWENEVEEAIKSGLPHPPKPNMAMDVGPFVSPRLCVSDSTVERLAVLLEASPRGMTYVADELSRLFLNMSRYSSGQDNEFWLEAWNGNHYTVERQGRPAVVLEHLLVGVIGGFQPDKLAKSFESEADGMYARMLFAWPEEPAYEPLTNEVAEIEPDILNALTRIIELADSDEDGTFAPKYVDLSDEAVAVFEQFRQFLHEGKANLDGREREWWAKGGAHVLRLAGTLAFLDWGMRGGAEPSSIDARLMKSAIHLWREYFWPHSRAALRQIGLSEKHGNARRALKWIRANRKSEVSREDLRRDALAQQLDAEQTQTLIDSSFVASSCLREVTKTRGGPGRRAHRWEVNPKLLERPMAAGIAGIAETEGSSTSSRNLRNSRNGSGT